MNRLTLLIAIITLLLSSTALRAQSVERVQPSTSETAAMDANARAIAALKRLDTQVVVYRSLSEFQESGKLARVSLQTFQQELSEVTRQVQPFIMQMPAGKLKTKLTNALESFRDGAYW